MLLRPQFLALLVVAVVGATLPTAYLLWSARQEALETELLAQGAACVLVSHDRSFVRAVGNRFWLIEAKKLVEVEDPEAFFKGALAQ